MAKHVGGANFIFPPSYLGLLTPHHVNKLTHLGFKKKLLGSEESGFQGCTPLKLSRCCMANLYPPKFILKS
jgi:hypothetical protein